MEWFLVYVYLHFPFLLVFFLLCLLSCLIDCYSVFRRERYRFSTSFGSFVVEFRTVCRRGKIGFSNVFIINTLRVPNFVAYFWFEKCFFLFRLLCLFVLKLLHIGSFFEGMSRLFENGGLRISGGLIISSYFSYESLFAHLRMYKYAFFEMERRRVKIMLCWFIC